MTALLLLLTLATPAWGAIDLATLGARWSLRVRGEPGVRVVFTAETETWTDGTVSRAGIVDEPPYLGVRRSAWLVVTGRRQVRIVVEREDSTYVDVTLRRVRRGRPPHDSRWRGVLRGTRWRVEARERP